MAKELGRPRDVRLDKAILQVGHDIVAEQGIKKASVEAIVSGAGTSRTSFYVRHKTIGWMLVEILKQRYEPQIPEESGDLEADLNALVSEFQSFLDHPFVQNCWAYLLGELHEDQDLANWFYSVVLGPRRRYAISVADRACARGDIPSGYDGEWIADLLLGPATYRTANTYLPPLSGNIVTYTVDLVMKRLRDGGW